MPHNRPPRMGGGFHRSRSPHSFHRSRSPHSHGIRYHSSSSHGNPICCCLIAIPICVIGFVIAGLALIFSSNDRPERIALFLSPFQFTRRYNEYATEWERDYKLSFMDASFQINSAPALVNKVTGPYFPVFDSCVKESEEGHCMAAESISYYSSLTLTGQDSVSVDIRGADGVPIWQETGATGYYLIYSRSEMNCDPYADDDESNSCYRKCLNKGGEYDDYNQECKIAYSLVRICLRVDGANNTFVPDTAQLAIPSSSQS